MYRRNSQKGKSLSQNVCLAQRVYSSNKTISRDKEDKTTFRKRQVSLHVVSNKKLTRDDATRKQDRAPPVMKPLQSLEVQEIVNLPAFKKIQSDSTASDFGEKTKLEVPKPIQRSYKTRSFMLARLRKNYEEPSNRDQQHPTISYEHQYSEQVCHQRRIVQCKIIKNPKIPFPVHKNSISRRKNLDMLIADTENISEIKIQADSLEFLSPQSRFLIDF